MKRLLKNKLFIGGVSLVAVVVVGLLAAGFFQSEESKYLASVSEANDPTTGKTTREMAKSFSLDSVKKANLKNKGLIGFNWGQLFHHLHIQYNNDGYAPDVFVKFLKDNYPQEMLENVRFSGTMSNFMLIDQPGYNSPKQNAQILKTRKVLAKQSYVYPFVDLYKKLDAKTLSFTFNSHIPFYTKKDSDLQSAFKTLDYIAQNTNLVAIELDNESYLSYPITGAMSAQPNAMERLALAGGFIQAANIKNVEAGMRKKINEYFDFLEQKVVPEIRKKYPDIPLGVSIAHESKMMRPKVYNEELLKRDFYDFLVPHVYYSGDISQASIEKEIKDKEIPNIGKKDVYFNVTEFNWREESNGPSDVIKFRENMFKALRNTPNVKDIYFHSIWHGKGGSSWIAEIPGK